jgi:prolyl-tRNA editing enzyme YbaK/EbsC (Cys-tRNA(Pro) deacylase)
MSKSHPPETGPASEPAKERLPVLQAILSLLEDCGASYRRVAHEPTRTSEDSARVRGEPLAVGGKALIVKAADRHVLLVVSAARRLDSAKLKRALGVKKTRFATPDELLDLTGLVPGAVPPFGEPILPLPLYVDTSVLANERIAFNAGSLTDSVIMPVDDYRRVASIDEVVDVTREE